MAIPLLVMVAFFGGSSFCVALILERFIFKPEAGTSKIFRATLVSAPLVAGIFTGLAEMVGDREPAMWEIFLFIALLAYFGSMLPAWARWAMARRNMTKRRIKSQETFR